MGMPAITEDQRLMITTLLANAIRKDAHLRNRAYTSRDDTSPLASLVQHRASPSQRYVDGMCDLIRVLFVNGDALVKDCLEDAYALTLGIPRTRVVDP